MEVGPSVFFSLLVIAVAFLPVFTLVDQEGRLFKPLAYTKNLRHGDRGDPRAHARPGDAHALHAHGLGAVPAALALVGLEPAHGRHATTPRRRHPVSRVLFRSTSRLCRLVAALAEDDDRRSRSCSSLATVPAYLQLGSRVHAAAQRGHRSSTCRRPSPASRVDARPQRLLQLQDRDPASPSRRSSASSARRAEPRPRPTPRRSR